MPLATSELRDPPDLGGFAIELNPLAERWLETHQTCSRIAITLSVTRCCGGPPVRDVRLRFDEPGTARRGRFVRIGRVAEREVLMDARLLNIMPRRIPMTVYKLLGRQRLSLELSGEQWGRLLYP